MKAFRISLMILICGTLVGCGADANQAFLRGLMSSYHGLAEDASWTYSDQISIAAMDAAENDTAMETPELDEDQLIIAHHLGEGRVELRRGSRWADAFPYGELGWDSSDGLALTEWSLPISSGTGNYPLAPYNLETEVSTSGDWSCSGKETELLETWYGTFDTGYVFDCAGGGLEGQFAFAFEFGLVWFEATDGYRLELVAPW